MMNFKEFGHTGRKVSEVGMGTYYDPMWTATATPGWRRDASKKVEAIKAGLDAGMTLVDTAEIYGSEPLVAKAIEGRKREDLFIATKVWPNHLRRDAVGKALRQSLQRLRLEYVDLYQIHWPNPGVPISETMGAMEELLAQGKIVNVGVSNFSLQQLVEANAALKKSRLASNQMSYSLLERSIERGILPYCQREGIAVMAYYPLAHGRLASGERRLEEFAKKRSKTPAQVALNWLTSKAGVFPIPRASDPAHVLEDAGVSGWRLSESEIGELERLFPVR
jgi:diketogulonate reductase-like aldo/keto reductase